MPAGAGEYCWPASLPHIGLHQDLLCCLSRYVPYDVCAAPCFWCCCSGGARAQGCRSAEAAHAAGADVSSSAAGAGQGQGRALACSGT